MINEGIKSGERDKKGENGFGVFFLSSEIELIAVLREQLFFECCCTLSFLSAYLIGALRSMLQRTTFFMRYQKFFFIFFGPP